MPNGGPRKGQDKVVQGLGNLKAGAASLQAPRLDE